MANWVNKVKKDFNISRMRRATSRPRPRRRRDDERDDAAGHHLGRDTRPARALALAEALLDLQELTERLRRDCPWDREQTEQTIVPHTVEEAYEVADAALAEDDAKLVDELGDLLFQVYFLSLLLSEKGRGPRAGRTRHPREARPPASARVRRRRGRHAGAVKANWEQIKRDAGVARRRVPPRRRGAAVAALCAQGAAARGGGRVRIPGRRGRARRSRRRAQRAARGARRSARAAGGGGRRPALRRRQRRAPARRRSGAGAAARRRSASSPGSRRRSGSPERKGRRSPSSSSTSRTDTSTRKGGGE